MKINTAMLVALFASVPAQAASFFLTVGSVSGNPGTDVSLSVTLVTGDTAVSGLQYSLVAPAALGFGSVTNGSAATAAGKSNASNVTPPNTFNDLVAGFNATPIGAGPVTLITLHIVPGTPNGSYPIVIQNVLGVTPDGQGVEADPCVNGAVTVTGGAPAAPVITSPVASTGDVGASFSYTITATNSPTGFGSTGLPPGLSVNAVTGVISGTPSAAGVFSVGLSATNAGGTGTSNLTLTLRAGANITLTKSALPLTAKSGDPVTFTIQYQNTSNGDATSVVVADVIPAGSTLVPASITGGGTLAGNTITWNLGTVSGNTSGNVSFQAKVN